MERKISVDYSFTFPFITDEQFDAYKDEALKAMETLENGVGAGNDFIGWRSLPTDMLKSEEFKEILEVGNEIYTKGDLLICVGIGGSYLGTKAVTDALPPKYAPPTPPIIIRIAVKIIPTAIAKIKKALFPIFS